MTDTALERVPLRALYPERFAAVRLTDDATRESKTVWIENQVVRERGANGDESESASDIESESESGVVRAAARPRAAERVLDSESRRLRSVAVGGAEGTSRVLARRNELRRMIAAVDARVLHSRYAQQQSEAVKQNSRDSEYLHHSRQVTWWAQQVTAVERISTASPMVVACMRLLKEHVLRDGIKFMRENAELVPSADFQEYVVNRLQPFVHQALDALLQIGIIPVIYELDPHTGQRWPYVPALGTYSISVYRVRGAPRYRFYWTNEQSRADAWQRQVVKTRDQHIVQWTARRECGTYNAHAHSEAAGGIEDPTVEILHNLGYDLASDGALTSKCATALNVVVQRMRSQASRMTAESMQAAPPVATEYNHQAEAQQSRNFQQGYFVSASSGPTSELDATDIANRTYVRDRAQQAQYASMLRQYEELSGRDASGEFGVPRQVYAEDLGGTAVVQPGSVAADGTRAQWANQYHVTQSRRLVALPSAHTQTDHVALLEHLDDQICSIFGVPRSYVQGIALRAGTDLVTDRLEHEVTALRRIMSDVLTRIYNELFLTEDAARLSQAIERRAQRQQSKQGRARRLSKRAGTESAVASALIDERDLFVSEAIRRVRVTFSKAPARDMQELLTMYGLGAIDRRTLCGEFARRNGFDASQMCQDDKKGSELPLEARRHLIPQLADYHKFKLAREQAQAQQEHARAQLSVQREQSKRQASVQAEQARAQATGTPTTTPAEPGAAGGKRTSDDSAPRPRKKAKDSRKTNE